MVHGAGRIEGNGGLERPTGDVRLDDRQLRRGRDRGGAAESPAGDRDARLVDVGQRAQVGQRAERVEPALARGELRAVRTCRV